MQTHADHSKWRGLGCTVFLKDVYLTFYQWHTELRKFNTWSHDKATVDVHGYVVTYPCTYVAAIFALTLTALGTTDISAWALRCLSLTIGNAKAQYAG